ncbi:MAG: glutathione ABC transporter ATP-binding protein [Dethiosulfovibrio peptidovorans]|nr:MAG: glutathione ABC transporter ATP-binding protein [Dethiosulfovibrio peptidovorans]
MKAEISHVQDPVMRLKNLHVRYGGSMTPAVQDLSFSLNRGECLSIIGQSGSGKSTVLKAITGLLPPSAQVRGLLHIGGKTLDLSGKAAPWLKIRGTAIGHIFQDAQQALNPMKTVRSHFKETLLFHGICSESETDDVAQQYLAHMNFTNTEKVLRAHSFELSGGMAQRVCIALSLCLRPRVLIADEVTSALDIVSQMEVLRLLEKTRKKLGSAILFITHDIRAARLAADSLLVLDDGEVQDRGRLDDILASARSPYTKELLGKGAIFPHVTTRPPGGDEPPLLRIEKLEKTYPGQKKPALKGFSLSVQTGEIVGILGESGCGKSTLARCIVGLERCESGSILLDGMEIQGKRAKDRRELKRAIQLVFQDGRGCLNPRRKATDLAGEPLGYLKLCQRSAIAPAAQRFLIEAGIPAELHDRRPPELSTGQCQRVAIARAISVQPKLLICDEAVSALDVGTRNHILELLLDIHIRKGISILMISHDLGVLKNVCHRIAVMKDGLLCDILTTSNLRKTNSHPYVRELFDLEDELSRP